MFEEKNGAAPHCAHHQSGAIDLRWKTRQNRCKNRCVRRCGANNVTFNGACDSNRHDRENFISMKWILMIIGILLSATSFAQLPSPQNSKLTTINQNIASLKTDLKKRNKKLSTLKQLSAPLQNEINSDREALKQQIRAAYFYSQQPYLKLLLSPDDRIQSQQMMMYFRYATQAQWRAMQQLDTSINQYQQNQAALQKQYAHLMQVKTSQLQHKKVLEKTQTERLTLIQQINQDIQTKHEKML